MVSAGDVDDDPMLLVTAGWAEYRPLYDWFQFIQSVPTVGSISTVQNATDNGINWTSMLSESDMDGSTSTPDGGLEYRSLPEIVIVCIVVVFLSLVTTGGNLLVIVSFKMDVQLQTVSNYFLLSLSVADLTIGLVSMPLYSVYLLMNYWPLGRVVCDAWLSLDYTMSNASVANLLLISFDRYFSVTRPLTYRARRTPSRAAAMIAGAWIVSALLWTPWILAWPYIEGRRTVPPRQCYIQFLETNKYFTILTAIAAFYLPVLIMSVLFMRIYRETEKRQKGLAELQGCGGSVPLLGGNFRGKTAAISTKTTGNGSSGRSGQSATSQDDTADSRVAATSGTMWKQRWRLPWRNGLHCSDRTTSPRLTEPDAVAAHTNPVNFRKSHTGYSPRVTGNSVQLLQSVVLHGYSCRRLLNDENPDAVDQASPLMGRRQVTQSADVASAVNAIVTTDVHPTTTTPSSTAMSNTMKQFFRHPLKPTVATESGGVSNIALTSSGSDSSAPRRETRAGDGGECLNSETIVATDEVELGDCSSNIPSILVTAAEDDDAEQFNGVTEGETPETFSSSVDGSNDEHVPYAVDGSEPVVVTLPPGFRGGAGGRRPAMTLHRVAMQACVAARLTQVVRDRRERKQRQQQEKKAEMKAARTLTAILLAFVVTWTPYNVFILIQAFCPDCIPPTLYAIGEY